MLTRFFLCALSLSVIQVTTSAPTSNPRSIGSVEPPHESMVVSRRGDIVEIPSAGQLNRRMTKRGCYREEYSRRSLQTRHRGGYSEQEDEDDDREDEKADDNSYSHKCSHYHSSSKKESGLPGLGGLGLGGGAKDGGGVTSMLSGAGSPMSMLGGGGGDSGGDSGGLPGNPLKMLGGGDGGGGGLPGNPMSMLGGGLPGNPMKMLSGGGDLPIDIPMKGLPGLG